MHVKKGIRIEKKAQELMHSLCCSYMQGDGAVVKPTANDLLNASKRLKPAHKVRKQGITVTQLEMRYGVFAKLLRNKV